MFPVAYEWKVDFAIVLSLLTLVATIVLWLLERRTNRRYARLHAYERVYYDACHILEFPLHKSSRETRSVQYVSDNAELEKAVRAFLDSHWMEQYWGAKKFVPPSLTTADQKVDFIRKVSSEASSFRELLSSHAFNLATREMSPVFHIQEKEVSERLGRIMKYMGKNLSIFSPDVRHQWENAKLADPSEIRHEYEKALVVCDHYFEHNIRDFDDPFSDLLNGIRREYRHLTRDRKQSIKWAVSTRFLKLKRAFSRLQVNIPHRKGLTRPAGTSHA